MGYFAREGYAWMFIGGFFTVASIVQNFNINNPISVKMLSLFIPAAITTSYLIFFFRDPDPIPPPNYTIGKTVLSPADGKICDIEEENGSLVFYIEMYSYNVHVTRASLSGKVKNVIRAKGKRFPIYFFKKINSKESKAVQKNARVVIEFEGEDGTVFFYNLVCGWIARRAKPYVKKGEFVREGQRVGIILFGSLVRITLPSTNYNLHKKIGDRVYGGKTILCEKLDIEKIN